MPAATLALTLWRSTAAAQAVLAGSNAESSRSCHVWPPSHLAVAHHLIDSGASLELPASSGAAAADAGGASPLQHAQQLLRDGQLVPASAGALVLFRGEQWSPRLNAFLPAGVRGQAAELLRVGYQLARLPMWEGREQESHALVDVWRSIVMPQAVVWEA